MPRCGVVLLPLILAFCISSDAQQNANLEEGLKPYGSFKAGQIDSVNLLNGNLSVRIPLFSYPQRAGKLDTSFFLAFSARPWSVQVFYQGNPPEPAYRWGAMRLPGVALIDGQRMSVTRSRTEISDENGGHTEIIDNYAVQTADGASHPLGKTGPNSYETIDASGIRFDFDPTTGTGTVTGSDGVRFLLDGFQDMVHPEIQSGGFQTFVYHTEISRSASVQDPNGNVISIARTFLAAFAARPLVDEVANVTDTLGRTVYSRGAATGPDPNCPNPAASQPTIPVTFAAPNNGTTVVKLCYSDITIQTSFGLSGVGESEPRSERLLTAVVLPNPTGASVPPRWLFTYDSYGNLTNIIFPTGGTITYQWTNVSLPVQAPERTTIGRGVSKRTVNDLSSGFDTDYSYGGVAGDGTVTNTVTDGARNDSVHTFSRAVPNADGYYETRTDSFTGTGSGRALLKRIDRIYSGNLVGHTAANVVPTSITTTMFPSSKTSLITKTFDSGNTFQDQSNTFPLVLGNVIEESEFDFGQGAPGSLLRKTITSYLALNDTNYKTANLLNLVSATIICSPIVGSETADGECGAGLKKRARTDFGYDEYGTSNQFGHSLGLVSSGIGVPTHNAVGNLRGNQTTVRRWRNLPTSSTLTNSFSFLDTGMVNWTEDAQGHRTSFEYAPGFLGAYLTKTTNALGQFGTSDYDFNTGVVKSTTDLNGKISSFNNYDTLFRLGNKTLPDGGSVTFNYTDSIPAKLTVTTLVAGTTNVVNQAELDGFGRTRLTKVLTDPDGTVFTRVQYDGLGRTLKAWNPARCDLDANPPPCSGDSTFGITTYEYDGLGRTTRVIPPDGTTSTNNVSTDFTNFPTVVVTDQQGKQRRTTTDALGRIVQVDEPGTAVQQ
jgi:YD repeat-containing protein